MRILIVGAGIAGLTLAALLQKRGAEASIIERSKDFSHLGYMLGLYPLGGNILHGLGLHQKFLTRSYPLRTYELRRGDGSLLKSYPLEDISRKYGPYQLISRQDLIELLLESIGPDRVRMNTTLSAITQNDREVEVRFVNGEKAYYDLVVLADGIHSSTRNLIPELRKTSAFDTGWGGWVWWAGPDKNNCNDVVKEFWGAGKFFGIYPTLGKLGVIAALPNARAKGLNAEDRNRLIKELFSEIASNNPSLFDALPGSDDLFYWHLSDVRARRWVQGRVVLLGDSAAGFLPTAGVGASMAMESAAVLNDILSRADVSHVGHALSLFEKRRFRRVIRAQTESRQLAKYMMIESPLKARLRDGMMRFYTVKTLLKSITASFDEPA